MKLAVLWALVGILMAGFVGCYGYVIGVSVKDFLARFRRVRPAGDESTYGKSEDDEYEPCEHGSDYFGGC